MDLSEDLNAPVDYEEFGSGPTVVLAPGSCSTAAAWRPIISEWSGRFHCVATSLLGYGRTAERRTADDPSIDHQAAALESVIWRAGRPVHLVGHSFGAQVGIAVTLRRNVRLESLTILEAPAPELLRICGEDRHYEAIRRMTRVYFEDFAIGNADAIGAMVDFYGGAGTFASWPERVRDYAMRKTPVNILDWASAYGFPLSPAQLATIDMPVLVAWGGRSHPAMRRLNALLGEHIHGATVAELGGAAHFMIATHAREVADLVGRHIARVARGERPASLSRTAKRTA
jgi:pimeloyl-ACP methyl ester carboxylesterase